MTGLCNYGHLHKINPQDRSTFQQTVLTGFSQLQRKGKNTKVEKDGGGGHDKRGHGRKNSGVNIFKMHCIYVCNCQRIKIFNKKNKRSMKIVSHGKEGPYVRKVINP